MLAGARIGTPDATATGAPDVMEKGPGRSTLLLSFTFHVSSFIIIRTRETLNLEPETASECRVREECTAKACEAYLVMRISFGVLTLHASRTTFRASTPLPPYRPFKIRLLEHRLARRRISPTDSVRFWTTPVLHNHRVDQLTTGHATPGTNVIEGCTLDEIQRIEWIDWMHETMAAVTDHAIHVVAS